MLELRNIRKAYVTAGFTQVALDDVSVAFRDNEFVAVLGASGSGKTTMLNILGGLDHADSGDIVINGISTKDYTDKDWDTYRNHRIGFIFQSYNLIPHQTVLSNVELALTLAGIDRAARKERARAALERVGLGDHVNKRPAQLSGGQMQRVAIARALVNDPDIVLADEPTGALDTETGIQVMDLLKEIADERLVIMVTHNPELAEQYATRIVRLQDGHIIDDTNPILRELDNSAVGDEAPADAAPVSDNATTETKAALFEGVGPLGEEGPRAAADSQTPAGEVPVPLPSTEDSSGPSASDFAPQARASEASAEQADGPDEAQALVGRRRSAGTSRDDVPTRHASMSFLTALALSFNNLMTKKGRTFMTAFAGSIGIIGIAAILALSNGVNDYIARTEQEALASYPLTITKSSFDLASMMVASGTADEEDLEERQVQTASDDGSAQDDTSQQKGLIPEYMIMSDMFARVKNNDLVRFKTFLESGDSGIEPYVSTIQYTYGITPLVYASDTSSGVVRLNPSKMSQTMTNGVVGSSFVGGMTAGSFQELLDDPFLLEQQTELVKGRWPESYDECVLVTSRGGWISDYTLYSLGVHDTKVMEDMMTQALNGDEVDVPQVEGTFTEDDAMKLTFKVVPAVNLYQKNAEQGTWTDMTGDKAFMKKVVDEGIELKVVGIVRPSEAGGGSSSLSEGIAYSPLLTKHLMEVAENAQIISEQRDNPDVDVFTGKTFEELQNDEQNEFDMGSMFVVDEEALQRAFSFDTSALSSFGQGMDLSGVSSAMSGMDLGDIDLAGVAANVDEGAIANAITQQLGQEFIVSLIQGMPAFEFEAPELTEEEQALVAESAQQLTTGFVAWLQTQGDLGEDPDYGQLLQTYLEKDEQAQAVLQSLTDALGPKVDQVREAIDGYLSGKVAPYVAERMASLMKAAAEVMMTQMQQQLMAEMNKLKASFEKMGTQLSTTISEQLSGQMQQLAASLQNGFSFDADAFAGAIQFNMTQEDLASLLSNYMNAEELSYDANLKKLGYASADSPESVSIYPIDFPAKESVLGIIDAYNTRMTDAGDEDATIQYTDFAGVLMGSVTDIVNTISLVLIAFVSISLVVSSIMISIITYISVLERKKEIGILRAMGASKLNVANIFNAETVIEGFIAGVLAILVVYAASIPVNAFIYETRGVPHIMQLPWDNALTLVCISVVLTLVAGLIPSSAAARRDPVEALRSE